MTIETSAAVAAAEYAVLEAAGWVVNSYRAGGGYTVPLSVNLQALAGAVDAWHSVVHTEGITISKPPPKPRRHVKPQS